MTHNRTNPSGRHRLLMTCGALLVVLLFCLPVYGQPANDECTGATVISSIPFMDTVDTTTATSNPADPSLSCNGSGSQTDGNTVWYVWTPSEDMTVNISTQGSTEPDGDPLDTAHGVYTGTCGSLTQVACVDIGLTDDLIFDATGGVTYYIKFGEFLDGVGGGELVVTVDEPPEPEFTRIESIHNNLSREIRDLLGSPGSVSPSSALKKKSPGADPSAEEVPVEEVPLFARGAHRAARLLAKRGARATPVEETLAPGNIQSVASAELLQSFDGAENDDNAFGLGILLAPPDTDGDVGPNHYVQMVNLLTTIYDKSGNTLYGPFANNVFWSGAGGLCQTTNQGDPIVLYDEEKDRWLVSQFAFNNRFTKFSLCVAVSATDDPAGSYYQHEFDFTGIGFPDYPKYGFVTDAVGLMVNLFTPPAFSFGGTGLGAIDKDELFSSGPATMVLFQLLPNEAGFAAGDNDGPVFDNMLPTFATNNNGFGNTIDFWEIDPDFAVPANSTISEVATVPVSPFDGDLCPAFRERCIPQPGSGTGTAPNNIPFLEAISDTLMHRLQLRDFGNGDKRAVVNHTITTTPTGRAGIRWYEFRDDGSGWGLHQQDTVATGTDHRWMGSIAMNGLGEICLGYSISGTGRYPSIGVRCQTSPSQGLGPENIVFDGNADSFVQRQTGRWGDYSAMVADPVDDTFWYTQEHAKPNSFIGERFGWATKIFNFEP